MYYHRRHSGASTTLSASSRLELQQHLFGAAGPLGDKSNVATTTGLFSSSPLASYPGSPTGYEASSPPAAPRGIVGVAPSGGERGAVVVDNCSSSSSRASRLVKVFASDQSGFELEDLKGCFIEFSKDQHGSRFLQKELEVVDSDMIQLVFDEVLPVARSLMVDVYGNYVIQKFFDFGTDEQRLLLVGKLCGGVVGLSLHLYGCRVVQKALETLPDYSQVQTNKQTKTCSLVSLSFLPFVVLPFPYCGIKGSHSDGAQGAHFGVHQGPAW